MSLRLFDSLTREIRELRPAQPDGVFRFYNCGPTVYAPAHIGNFRTFVVNDLIRRLVELEFGPDKIKHVRNLTDVDDKTIRRAREEGRSLAAVTQQWTDKFHADCAALNCLSPHEEPRATDPRFMREQVDMIEVLMAKGNAYRAPDGSVYFKVSSFDSYGRLSRVKDRELQLGSALAAKTHAADADEKEDLTDFALWKAHKPEDGDVKWPGPNGAAEGRPGWHIECSAMSRALLGPTIDLHTGGVDLLFPHHENEIAQSECCNGTTFARHWYHSEHLLVDGKKMSKSLGNLYTLDDLRAKGVSPMALRYALLTGHPRKQLNFTLDSLHAAEKALTRFRKFAADVSQVGQLPKDWYSAKSHLVGDGNIASDVWRKFWEHLTDDLNTPGALGELFTITERQWQQLEDLVTSGHPIDESDLEGIRNSASQFARALFALGLDLAAAEPAKADAPADVKALAEKRWTAKQAKDFKTADALRAEITATGWQMLDRKDGYSLEALKR
jgi:cysteinyl-tRNA synthetase